MEEILESPKVQTDEQILARVAMTTALKDFILNKTIKDLRIFIIGRNERLAGALRRAGNRNPKSLNMLYDDVSFEELEYTHRNTMYFYDSKSFNDKNNLLKKLKKHKCTYF